MRELNKFYQGQKPDLISGGYLGRVLGLSLLMASIGKLDPQMADIWRISDRVCSPNYYLDSFIYINMPVLGVCKKLFNDFDQ